MKPLLSATEMNETGERPVTSTCSLDFCSPGVTFYIWVWQKGQKVYHVFLLIDVFLLDLMHIPVKLIRDDVFAVSTK